MEVGRAVDRHRRWLDRLLPGRVEVVHVTGSTALGAYVPGRSDIDVVVVLDRRLDRGELIRLRVAQRLASVPCAVSGVVRRRWAFPGNVNGVYVTAADLARPVAEIDPVASHSGTSFAVGAGFDVNPVMWTTLAGTGAPVVRPAVDETVAWCRDNLRTWWRAEADRLRGRRLTRWRMSLEVVNVPRLWVTATTGEVVSKEEAGERALVAFDERWHPLLHDALAWRAGGTGTGAFDPRQRADRTATWIDHVCDVVLSA
jgi:hypothetical protein